jgi:hypothetical protein
MTHPPKILHLDLLDTDYAKIVAGEPIPEDRQRRLEAADPHTLQYLSKQIARYRYAHLNQAGKDDVLCNIGLTVGLLTPADIEDINDRLRATGEFYLTPGERQQILNWLQDEFGIFLKTPEN